MNWGFPCVVEVPLLLSIEICGVSLNALGGVLGGLGGPRGAPRGPWGHGFNRLWVLQGALWGLLFIVSEAFL